MSNKMWLVAQIPSAESPSAGAPSVVNAGGTVGAADLLQAPSEVFELDLALPIAQLASQV